MLEINDELARNIHMSEREIKLEFSVWLYETEKVSLRKAASLSGLDWVSFSKILVERNIPTVKMNNDEFEKEVDTVNWLLK